MPRLLLVLLLLSPLLATAQVYKHVDQDGNVTFSDIPAPDSEKIDVPTLGNFDLNDPLNSIFDISLLSKELRKYAIVIYFLIKVRTFISIGHYFCDLQ